MKNRKQERIDEILSLAKEQDISNKLIDEIMKTNFTESKLHDIVWLLREKIPEDFIELVIQNNHKIDNIQIIIKSYQSDEINNV